MFDWNEANVGHLLEHNVLPNEAEQVIQNIPLDLERQIHNGEERMVHLGETNSSRVLVVVTTMREELIRVVTAYDANRKLRKFYATQRGFRNVEKTRDP
jgi:uncharacterized protein